MLRANYHTGLLLLVLPGCQWLAGYDDFAGGEEADPHRCADLPEWKLDGRGGGMVRVDLPGTSCLWIDRDEVTVAQYDAWLAYPAVLTTTWNADFCAWKAQPSQPSAVADDACSVQARADQERPFDPEKPIRCVDWCDAEAFCRWSGKHLCYDRETNTQVPRDKSREWYFACNNGESTVYPWGMEAEGGDCNVGQGPEFLLKAERGPLPVSFSSACTSAFGARNLVGNVAEWTYGCNFMLETDRGKVTPCLTRGGAYYDPIRTCIDARTLPNDTRDPGVGFRCCADLTVEESLEVSVESLPPP